ncbi:MAG: SCO family protein [Rubrivivax sp.]|nr:SCO family protein [Rubrivivax sp.]
MHSFTRRHLLRGLSGGAAVCGWPMLLGAQTTGHGLLGPVDPRPTAPGLPLTLHDGRPTRLEHLLRGRLTALQLMFTGCSSTCPIQGAVFAGLQQRLAEARLPAVQLLSVSIDPLGDDARALAAWRQRFHAGEQWLAAVPPLALAERLPDFLASRPTPGKGADGHTPQVYLFDRQGRLAYRMAELASATSIVKALGELARLG